MSEADQDSSTRAVSSPPPTSWITVPLATKVIYAVAVVALPALDWTLSPPTPLPLHLFVLLASFPAHLGGFLSAFLHTTPHGWAYDAGGRLVARPGATRDPRWESSADYLARTRRSLARSVVVLEAPSVAAVAVALLGYPSAPLIWIVVVGFLLTAFLRVRLRQAEAISAAMAAAESE